MLTENQLSVVEAPLSSRIFLSGPASLGDSIQGTTASGNEINGLVVPGGDLTRVPTPLTGTWNASLPLLRRRFSSRVVNEAREDLFILFRYHPAQFFQRRKFLKKVNSLELTPLRLLGHTAGEGAKVSVLLPRFRGTLFGTFLQARTNRKYIQIRLDEFGSATWLLIDGKLTVEAG